MSKDWAQEELQAASKVMKAAWHLGYENFANNLTRLFSQPTAKISIVTLLK